jgi:uncharacterized protein (DUF2267 family)
MFGSTTENLAYAAAAPQAGRPARAIAVTYDDWVSEVAARAGAADRGAAEHAVAATLDALGRRLRPVDARAVANALPARLGAALLRSSSGDHGDLDDFQRRLGGVPACLVRAVCRVLAESLDEQARAQLRMQPLTRLFC